MALFADFGDKEHVFSPVCQSITVVVRGSRAGPSEVQRMDNGYDYAQSWGTVNTGSG